MSFLILLIFNVFGQSRSSEYFYQSVLELEDEKEKVVINFSIKENDSLIIYQSENRVKIIDLVKEEVINVLLGVDTGCYKLPLAISLKMDSAMNGGYKSYTLDSSSVFEKKILLHQEEVESVIMSDSIKFQYSNLIVPFLFVEYLPEKIEYGNYKSKILSH